MQEALGTTHAASVEEEKLQDLHIHCMRTLLGPCARSQQKLVTSI